MPPQDPEEFRSDLETIVERLTHWEVQKAIPDPAKKRELQELEEMRGTAQRLLEAFAEWQREQRAERRLADWLEAMNAGNSMVLEAIRENTQATRELLIDRRSVFQANPEVIAEGEFLAQTLAVAVQGTEGPSGLLKDGVPPPVPTGLEVLAEALGNVSFDETTYVEISVDEKE